MKIHWLWWCFLVPVWLSAQDSDPVLDSLKRPLPPGASARAQAERLIAILDYPNADTYLDADNYPRQLDSLYNCCLSGKTGDRNFEKKVETTAIFFKAWLLVLEQPDKAKPMLEQAVLRYAELGDSTGVAYAYVGLCNVASGLGDTLLFAGFYEQAMRAIKAVKDPEYKTVLYCNVGICCYDFGHYTKAAANYFEALALIDRYQTPVLKQLVIDVYHNLSAVYRRIGDYDNALSYALKTVELSQGKPAITRDAYTVLGWVYIFKKDFRHALEAMLESSKYPIPKDGREQVTQAISNYALATCYRNLGELDKALPLAQKAAEMLPISVNAPYGGAALDELASCEFASGMTERALAHALTAYQTFVNSSNNRGIVSTTELLTNIYRVKGNYRKALEYSELRYKYQNQIERQQSTRQLAFGEFTRNAEVEKARREAEVQAELKQQRNIRYALFAGLILLALLALLLFNRYRFKQKTAEQLETKNHEVEVARARAEQERARAETSEAFKSRFLANMSHEIRTPLHGIAGFADLLLETSLSEKQRRWLSSIQHSTDRLGEVVNDILDLSKLEAGEVKLRQIPFSPARLAADVQDALALRAEQKGIALRLEVSDKVPPALLGDPTRLYQILMNLAGNAVKFTEKGSVTIGVNEEHSGAIRFAVKDSGIGIPPEKLNSIFDSFQQAGEDTTARFGGTGLGLTIARDLVRLHGSDIQVQSVPGEGSTFSFTLALPQADAFDLEREHKAEDLYFSQSLRILLADDNDFNREIATEALYRHFEKVEITEAGNGKEVLGYMQKQDFDLILMDMQMPEMNGTEATRHIRNQLSNPIPIIALTASATPGEIENAFASGMNRHLGKPFKPAELAQVIAETLHLNAHSEAKRHHHHQTIQSPEQRNPVLDLSFLRDFCDGDEFQMQQFLLKFNEKWPEERETLMAAFQLNDKGVMVQIAHGLRPQLEFVGLKAAADLLLELETLCREDADYQLLSTNIQALESTMQQFEICLKAFQDGKIT